MRKRIFKVQLKLLYSKLHFAPEFCSSRHFFLSLSSWFTFRTKRGTKHSIHLDLRGPITRCLLPLGSKERKKPEEERKYLTFPFFPPSFSFSPTLDEFTLFIRRNNASVTARKVELFFGTMKSGGFFFPSMHFQLWFNRCPQCNNHIGKNLYVLWINISRLFLPATLRVEKEII